MPSRAVPTSPAPAASARLTARQLRTLRGISAAGVATVVASTAHTLAGGGAPSAALVAVVILLAAPVAVALAGRTLALWRLALTVLASQLVFHVAFALSAGATGAAGAAAAHAHHGALVLDSGPAAAWTLDPLMLLGHAVAAVVTIAALHRGERMLRSIVRGLLRLLAARWDVPRPDFPALLAPSVPGERGIRPPLFVTEVSRRGPPVGCAAL
ncbi:hypothetical protein [Microbacterium sp. SS28]|uniref:hypothetical protein n=1 Tax=Microbacterium sp. SS28 TaxID=2919948 RepID=UPI001FAAE5BE|nr:hypothetical protein [Microbacterium sp. SS28]